MRCGTSFYNGTLAKQLTLRFWPLAALYSLVLAIILPLRGLTDQVLSHATEAEYYTLIPVMGVFRLFTPWMALFAGGIAAMVVCSHLYSTRSANFTAALAPKRTALFATHYLTGLLWLVVPFLVMSLGALGIYLAKVPNSTQLVWQVFGQGMAVGTAALLLFYSFGVLCGMLTGHILALPVFYTIFNGLVAGLWFLLTLLFQEFYYGYPGSLTHIPAWVMWLTPSLHMGQAVAWFPDRLDVIPIVVYGVVGVVMALGAWGLYVKRPMERAGDVVAWMGLRGVFRYGVAICVGLSMGSLTRLVLNLGQLGLAVSVLLWGVIGCFVAQMLLTKSVRVLRYWKGAGAVALTFVVLFLVMAFDLTGYETRVPQADGVASVTISGLYSFPSDTASEFQNITTRDPQAISLVTQLHQQLVNQRKDYGISGYYDNSTNLDVTYTLSNGTRLSRSYSVLLLQGDVDQPGTITNLAHQLVNDPGLMVQSYLFDQLEADGFRIFGGRFHAQTGSEGSPLTASEAQLLRQAVCQDIQAGNMPRTLFESFSGETYIELEWSTGVGPFNPTPSTDTPVRTRYVSVHVPSQAEHTWEALKQLGF